MVGKGRFFAPASASNGRLYEAGRFAMIEGFLIAAVVGLLISLRSTVLVLCVVVLMSAAALAIGGALVGAGLWQIILTIGVVAIALEFGYMLGPALQLLLQGKRSDTALTEHKSLQERKSDL